MKTWTVVALAALVLAGCASPEPAPAPQPVAPAPVFEQVPVAALVDIRADSCLPADSLCTGSYAARIAATNETQAPRAIHLTVADLPNQDDEIEWELTCVGDDQGCRQDLAEGRGVLPLAIDVEGLQLLPAVQIRLELRAPSVVPGADYALETLRGQTTITGIIVAEAVAARQFDFVAYGTPVEVAVSGDGDTGPQTLPDYPGLAGTGKGVVFYGPETEGRIGRVNLTVTWTSLTPLDQELFVRVGSACDTCSPALEQVGTSPLVFDVSGLVFKDYVYIDAQQPELVPLVGPMGLLTQYHVEGTLTVLPELD